jgi:hypothetical protein
MLLRVLNAEGGFGNRFHQWLWIICLEMVLLRHLDTSGRVIITPMPYEGIKAITPPRAVGYRTMNPMRQVGQQVSPLILNSAERRWAARDGARQALSPLSWKNVGGSGSGRKRWWLYTRAHCGHGTPYAFLSRLRDIQRERPGTGRFHVVASPKVECGVAADRRRLCVRMMIISEGMPRGESIRQRALRSPVKKSICVVDRIRHGVRCRGKRGSKKSTLIYRDGLRCYRVGTAASTSGVSVLLSIVSTPLRVDVRALKNVSYYY